MQTLNAEGCGEAPRLEGVLVHCVTVASAEVVVCRARPRQNSAGPGK